MEIFELQILYKPVETIEDIKKINDDIGEIVTLLSTTPFDEIKARKN